LAEWQRERSERKRVSDKICREPIRRKESSSDRRLKKAFGGARGPATGSDA